MFILANYSLEAQKNNETFLCHFMWPSPLTENDRIFQEEIESNLCIRQM